MSKLINVSDETFEAEVLQSDKVVVLDFSAQAWCGACVRMKPVIEKFAEENPDLKVCIIDIDDNAKMAGQYKVKSIPSIHVFKNGQDLGFTGSLSLADLQKFVASKINPTEK